MVACSCNSCFIADRRSDRDWRRLGRGSFYLYLILANIWSEYKSVNDEFQIMVNSNLPETIAVNLTVTLK